MKQTTLKDYRTLFNRLTEHKMNTMHQLREIALLSLFDHFYQSFSLSTLTLPRFLHQLRIAASHNLHESLTAQQLIHAARLIPLLSHSTPQRFSVSLLQQVEVRLDQSVL